MQQVSSHLFVNLGELLKIVLKKGYFLLLCSAAPCVIGVHLSALQNKNSTGMRSSRTRRDCVISSGNPPDFAASVTQTAFLLWVRPFGEPKQNTDFCHFTFFTLVAKSWTKSFLKLWSVCSSLAFKREGKTILKNK